MIGVAGLLAWAAGYDAWCHRRGGETISCAVRRLSRLSWPRMAMGAGLGVLVAHLTEVY